MEGQDEQQQLFEMPSDSGSEHDYSYEESVVHGRCKYCYRVEDVQSDLLYLSCQRCLREGCQACLPLTVPDWGSYVYLCMNCYIELQDKRQAEEEEEQGDIGSLWDEAFKDDELPQLEEDSDYEREEESDKDPQAAESDSESDGVYDETLYEQQLESARADSFVMPLPWESGWLSVVMGDRQVQDLLPIPGTVPIPALPQSLASVQSFTTPPTANKNRIFKKRRVEFAKEIRQDRQAAIRLCVSLLLQAPGTSVIAKQIEGLSEEQSMQTVADTLEDKSTGTIKSRTYSLSQFVRWMSSCGKGVAFPVKEADVYEYVVFLRFSGAPPTRATRFRQALAFGKFVLGIQMEDDVLTSRRSAGAALASFRRKGLLKQRSPLTKLMVELLERAVVMGSDLQEVVFVGHCLFTLHVRCRYSDMMWVSIEPQIEGPYLEAATHKHKTSNLQGRQNKWLPLAGLAEGVSGLPWAASWLKARQASGLVAGENKPFLPAPLADGSWSDAKLTLGEATLWLREIFVRGGFVPSALIDLGTHSLKCTLLSWLAKSGTDHEARRLLGGHISKADGSMIAYSRDGLAGPLLKLLILIEQVRSGDFDPDMNRAGRWKHMRDSEAAEVESYDDGFVKDDSSLPCDFNFVAPQPKRMARILSETFSDVSSSSGSEERDDSSDEAAFDKAANTVLSFEQVADVFKAAGWKKRAAASDVDPNVLWKHAIRHTFHLGKMSDCSRTGCGRLLEEKYIMCHEFPNMLWPRCSGCFGNDKPEESGGNAKT